MYNDKLYAYSIVILSYNIETLEFLSSYFASSSQMTRNFRVASGGIVGADHLGFMYFRSFANYETSKTMGEERILICILTYASECA